MTQQLIRIRLKGYDCRILDQAASQILEVVLQTGAEVKGPIPLPRQIDLHTVNRSPHVNKKSMEQFAITTMTRVLDIKPAPTTVEVLKTLVLSSGVAVEIKVS